MHDWPDLNRKRSLTAAAAERVERWQRATHSELDRYACASALLAISDGTWVDDLFVIQDFERRNRFHVAVNPRIVITLRLYLEFPGVASIDRIGPM